MIALGFRENRETPSDCEVLARFIAPLSFDSALGEHYFATIRITKLPGFIFPRRSPGAGGSKSAAGRKCCGS